MCTTMLCMTLTNSLPNVKSVHVNSLELTWCHNSTIPVYTLWLNIHHKTLNFQVKKLSLFILFMQTLLPLFLLIHTVFTKQSFLYFQGESAYVFFLFLDIKVPVSTKIEFLVFTSQPMTDQGNGLNLRWCHLNSTCRRKLLFISEGTWMLIWMFYFGGVKT